MSGNVHLKTFAQVKIALKTVKIRNAQHELMQQWPYKNQPMKHQLTHMYETHTWKEKLFQDLKIICCHARVSNRRNMIRKLRESDYKKYEWLLEK